MEPGGSTRFVQRLVYVITHCIAIYVVHYDTITIHIHITNNRCLDTGLETSLHTSCFLHIYTQKSINYKNQSLVTNRSIQHRMPIRLFHSFLYHHLLS